MKRSHMRTLNRRSMKTVELDPENVYFLRKILREILLLEDGLSEAEND